MDIYSIIFICLLVFTALAFIAILVYVFQPKYARESKIFSKKEKKVSKTTEQLEIAQNNTNAAPTKTPIQREEAVLASGSVSNKPLLSINELNDYIKISNAIKGSNAIVLPQVNYSDFIAINPGSKTELYKILPYLKADFLICDSRTAMPICIIKDKNKDMEFKYRAEVVQLTTALKISLLELNGINDATLAQIRLQVR